MDWGRSAIAACRRWSQWALVSLLAAGALVFGSGCIPVDFFVDIDGVYVLLCVYMPKANPPYQLRTYDVFFGRFDPDEETDGKPCNPSDQDDERNNTASQPTSGAGASNNLPPQVAIVDRARAAVQSLFGSLPPLPGVPFPTGTSPPPPCSSNATFYIVSHGNGTVGHYSLCPLRLLRTIGVQSNPLQLALTPDGATLVVTSYDHALTFIDTASDTVVATLATPNRYPNGIAISPDGQLAYVTNFYDVSQRVMVVDLAARKIVDEIPVTGAFPKSVILTPDGSQLWVLYYQSTSIDVIDTLTRTVNAQVPVAGQADTGMAFNPTGTRAYVAVSSGQLAVIDTATLRQVASVPIPSPTEVAVTPNGQMVVVRGYSSLTTVNARTNTVIGSTDLDAEGGMGLVVFH